MITNFEEITRELSIDEQKIIPVFVKAISLRDEKHPIKAPEIIESINAHFGGELKRKLSEPRLRKMANFIRAKGIIPLIATSHGYYVSYDKSVVASQIKSLRERASAINVSADGLEKFLK